MRSRPSGILLAPDWSIGAVERVPAVTSHARLFSNLAIKERNACGWKRVLSWITGGMEMSDRYCQGARVEVSR